MRFFSLLFFFSVIVFSNSCGMFSGTNSQPQAGNSKIGSSAGSADVDCQNSQKCKKNCNDKFVTEDLLKKCLSLSADSVSKIYSVVSAMETGSWDTIKVDHLSVLIEFDDDIWPKYAGVKDRSRARAMLLWVAKEKKVGDLLEEDQKALKTAFEVLGGVRDDNKIQTALQEKVDIEEQRTFFEVSVFNKNDNAFKAGHILLKKECEEKKSCVEQVYCAIDEDTVFNQLNHLDLVEDTGGSLTRGSCN